MTDLSLTHFLHRACDMRPGSIATRFERRERTWSALAERALRFAGALLAGGTVADDRVAMLAQNSDNSLEAFFGIWAAGAVIMPLNVRLADAELCQMLTDGAPVVLLVDEAGAARLNALRGAIPGARLVYIGNGPAPEGIEDYETLVTTPQPARDTGRAGHDLAAIMYTGGTTGVAKGVMLSHAAIVATLLVAPSLDTDSDEQGVVSVLPLFHIAGLVLALGAVVAPAMIEFQRSFDPEALMAAIESNRSPICVLVPAMWGMLIRHPRRANHDLSSIKHAMYGASPMPLGLLRECMATLPAAEFVQGYGQTETGGTATRLAAADHVLEGPRSRLLGSAGKPVSICRVKVVDPQGQSLPPGPVGEIAVSGPTNMLGYWNRPEETARAIVDGWVMTGDAGYFDEKGYLFIVDRVKDMIISGGENVFSGEVEAALSTHPAVQACAVIGIPDDTWGEAVHAIVVFKPGASADAEALHGHCRERIAGFKCPRGFTFRSDPLPLTAAGKVQKSALREPFWRNRGRGVN